LNQPLRISLLLILLGAILYLPGLNWGVPGLVSWSQDSVAAFRTLGATADWPRDWKGRYPPLHYLILRGAYEPVLRYWEAQGAAEFDPATRHYRLKEPQAPKVGVLILIARVVSALMAIGAGVAIYFAARRLLNADLAGAIAAGAFMIGADFTYFAHLDNVDAASIFWLAMSLVFFARLIESHRMSDAALLGLFGALAISTKDAVAGVYPGMAIFLLCNRWRREPGSTCEPNAALEGRRYISSGGPWHAVLLQPHWPVGILCFALPYLFINGALHNWDAYVNRMSYWLSPPPEARHAQQIVYDSQAAMMAAVVRYAGSAVGWPMLVAMIAAWCFAAIRHRRLALLAGLPVVTYYAIVIVSQGFVYSRFLFAPLVFLSIPLGWAGARIVPRSDWPIGAPALLVGLVALPSLGYAVAVNTEMLTDSRYAAEAWFAKHVPPPSSVGAFALTTEPVLRPQYLPRLHEMGYATYPVVMAREWFDRPQPQYLVVDSFTSVDFDDHQKACLRDLLRGELGYRLVAMFEGQYLPPQRSWLSIAGWGTPALGKISPRLVVLQRMAQDMRIGE